IRRGRRRGRRGQGQDQRPRVKVLALREQARPHQHSHPETAARRAVLPAHRQSPAERRPARRRAPSARLDGHFHVAEARMKVDARTIKGLRTGNGLLREQNAEIRNAVQMRRALATNSLATLSGAGFGASGISPLLQTPITSFSPLLQNNIYAPITLDWT